MKSQLKFKKYKKPSKFRLYWFDILLIIISSGLIYSIFNIYQKIYQTKIEANLKIREFNNLIIKNQYIEMEKTVEKDGKEKVVKILERKPPMRQKPAEREVKGIYLTAYGVATPSIYNRAMRLLEETELNGVVIDIKDYSGELSYDSNVPLVEEIGADARPKIKDIKKIINELHKKDIYIIARQTIFQDSVLSRQKPEWAVQNKFTGRHWIDKKGLGWVDPTVKEVWDYNIAIAKEAAQLGFDEINLDYIRFPTDGNIKAILFKNLPGEKTKHKAIREFFEYFSTKMKNEPVYLSADLFGLTTIKAKEEDDLGIGQLLTNAIPYFDYICPMVYPSHYASGFNGYSNPAEHPYEIVKYSMEKAKEAFKISLLIKESVEVNKDGSETSQPPLSDGLDAESRAKLRPWLQDFDLGATYDAVMVKKQIQAADEVDTFGWLLWDPRNMYTEGALNSE